jgi:hypothetical protein
MKVFPDELNISDAGMNNGSRHYRLDADFRYSSSKGIITVPKGFITDGASVPRAFWSIFPPFGASFYAAVIHDWLYSKKSNHSFTRAQCDEIFKEAMFNTNMTWVSRGLIYRSVRAFGWKFYKKG